MVKFIIRWLLFGFLMFIISCVVDMRGKEFDENHFRTFGEMFSMLIGFMVCGYATIFIFLLYGIEVFVKKTDFNKIKIETLKLLYDLANFDINRKDR